jgi:hypothetical protein
MVQTAGQQEVLLYVLKKQLLATKNLWFMLGDASDYENKAEKFCEM